VNIGLPDPARVIASVIHAVVSEYRKLDAPPPPAAAAEPARTEINNTAASTAQAWQPHHRAPAAARAFGFVKEGLTPESAAAAVRSQDVTLVTLLKQDGRG